VCVCVWRCACVSRLDKRDGGCSLYLAEEMCMCVCVFVCLCVYVCVWGCGCV